MSTNSLQTLMIISLSTARLKLLRNPDAYGANEIFRNAATAVPLKHLSSYWNSLEMPLLNCKFELSGQIIVF